MKFVQLNFSIVKKLLFLTKKILLKNFSDENFCSYLNLEKFQ